MVSCFGQQASWFALAVVLAIGTGCSSSSKRNEGDRGTEASSGGSAAGATNSGAAGTSGGRASGGTAGAGTGGVAAGAAGKGASGGSAGCAPDSTFCTGTQLHVCTAAGTDSIRNCVEAPTEGNNDLVTGCRTCSRGARCTSPTPFATGSLSGVDTFSGPIDGCEASGYAYRNFSVNAIDDGALDSAIETGTTTVHFYVRRYTSFPSGVQQTIDRFDGTFSADESRVQAVGPVTFTLTYGADSNVGSPIKIEASATFTSDFVDMFDVTYVYDGVFTTIDEML